MPDHSVTALVFYEPAKPVAAEVVNRHCGRKSEFEGLSAHQTRAVKCLVPLVQVVHRRIDSAVTPGGTCQALVRPDKRIAFPGVPVGAAAAVGMIIAVIKDRMVHPQRLKYVLL